MNLVSGLLMLSGFMCRMRSEFVLTKNVWLLAWRAIKRVSCRLTRSGTADVSCILIPHLFVVC